MTAPAPGDKAAKTRGELLMGPVFPMVVKFGVPTMVSMLTPAIYNLTGAYFVSTLGTTAVAALGIVFSLHMILAAVGIMTGQGCASQTSRLLGAGEYEAAGFIAGTGILLSVLGGVAIGVLGLLFDEPLLRVLGATPTIMPDAVRYAEVLLIGSPVVCASFTFNNLLRSEGLAVVGMRALLAGGILNLALTPAFILGLGFGIEGRARPGPPSSPRRRVCSSSSITTAGRRGSSGSFRPRSSACAGSRPRFCETACRAF